MSSNAPKYFEAVGTDQVTHKINQEYLYGQKTNESFNSNVTERRKEVAKENEIDNFELLQRMAHQSHLREAGKVYGGEFTKAVDGGELEQPDFDLKSSKHGKSLRSFIEKEQEEEDIYEMYQRKVD